MEALRPELASALARQFPGARCDTIAADASTRRFHRLFLGDGGTCVVMDYGSAFAGETDDIRLARIFGQAHLPVAKVLQVLPEAGALVLEDLGDETLESALSRHPPDVRSTRNELYRSAVRLAAAMATQGSDALARSDRAEGPALDEDRFLFEMNYFLEHFVGDFQGKRNIPTSVRKSVEELARTTASHPRVLCHRDYHSRNVMVRAGGTLSLVDIQDARWGPDTYDLASLLRDAYVDLDEVEVDEYFNLYHALLRGTAAREELRARFDLVAAQRMIKALGTFGYQVSVLGRERYRGAIPRTLARLERLLPRSRGTSPIAEAFTHAGITHN